MSHTPPWLTYIPASPCSVCSEPSCWSDWYKPCKDHLFLLTFATHRILFQTLESNCSGAASLYQLCPLCGHLSLGSAACYTSGVLLYLSLWLPGPILCKFLCLPLELSSKSYSFSTTSCLLRHLNAALGGVHVCCFLSLTISILVYAIRISLTPGPAMSLEPTTSAAAFSWLWPVKPVWVSLLKTLTGSVFHCTLLAMSCSSVQF